MHVDKFKRMVLNMSDIVDLLKDDVIGISYDNFGGTLSIQLDSESNLCGYFNFEYDFTRSNDKMNEYFCYIDDDLKLCFVEKREIEKKPIEFNEIYIEEKNRPF